MKTWFSTISRCLLAAGSAASLIAGAIALQSCGGEGGPVGSNGNGGGGGDTSIARQFQALLPAGQAGATYVGPNRCADCHNGQTGAEPIYDHWMETTHQSVNVTCENCHGPGSAHAAAPAKTNILTFPKSASAIVCAQCHGPIYDQWKESPHAEIVEHPVVDAQTSPASYGRTSRCLVCHSGSIMRTQYTEQGIDPNNMTDAQIIQASKDTMDFVPNTATCATCHNPHHKTGKLDKDGEEHQIRHETYNTDTSTIGPGTTAIQFTNFDQTCAECHNGRGATATDAALTSGTSRPNVHDSPQFNMLMGVSGVEGAGPVDRATPHSTASGQCTHCHMPNASHTFQVNYDTSCQPCHSAADAAARATSVKAETINNLYSLQTRMANWAQATFGDGVMWDYTSNITALGKTAPNQTLIPIQVKRARHNYYYIIRDLSMGVHNAYYTRLLIQVANDNLTAAGIGALSPGDPSGRGTGNLSTSQKAAIIKRQLQLARQADQDARD